MFLIYSKIYSLIFLLPAPIREFLSIIIHLSILLGTSFLSLFTAFPLYLYERYQASLISLPDYRHVLITGASSGIGRGLAEYYSKKSGIRLLLIGKKEEKLEIVAKLCQQNGAIVAYEAETVTDQQAMEKVIDKYNKILPIDLVFTAAGLDASVFPKPAIWDCSREILNVNVMGTLNTILPVIPMMKQQKKGQIVLISSLASFMPAPIGCDYFASKAAVRSYGESLRILLKSDNIAVNVVCPGGVNTPLMDAIVFRNSQMPMILETDQAVKLITEGVSRNTPVVAWPGVQVGVLSAIGSIHPSLRAPLLPWNEEERQWRFGHPTAAMKRGNQQKLERGEVVDPGTEVEREDGTKKSI
jgi:short-subunit dehydrogenase